MENFEDKIYVLNEKRENLRGENDGQISLKRYVKLESQTDPGFFRWLFDYNFEEDFDQSLTAEQKKVFEQWLDSL
jgi:hypothetical protein